MTFYIFKTIHRADCQYRNGDIRLVGGSYQWEGRVEIYLSETWGTITDSNWTSADAQVVCRKLGHFKPGAKVVFCDYVSVHLRYDIVLCDSIILRQKTVKIAGEGDFFNHKM